MEFETVEIANLDIAAQVHENVLAHYYAGQLTALAEAAGDLGYLFVRTSTVTPLPPVLKRALAYAVAKKKRVLNTPYDTEKAEEYALSDLEDGFADSLRDAILDALAGAGIRLRATADAEDLIRQAEFTSEMDSLLKRVSSSAKAGNVAAAKVLEYVGTPSPTEVEEVVFEDSKLRPAVGGEFLVNVVGDEVFVSNDGLFVVYSWKPSTWSNVAKKVSVSECDKQPNEGATKTYSVVTGDGDKDREVIAQGLSQESAVALVKRIEAAVGKHVGIPTGDEPPKASGIGHKFGQVAANVVIGVSIVAAICAVAFAMPFAFKAGDRVAAKLWPATKSGPTGSVALLPVPPELHCEGPGCEDDGKAIPLTLTPMGPTPKK